MYIYILYIHIYIYINIYIQSTAATNMPSGTTHPTTGVPCWGVQAIAAIPQRTKETASGRARLGKEQKSFMWTSVPIRPSHMHFLNNPSRLIHRTVR